MTISLMGTCEKKKPAVLGVREKVWVKWSESRTTKGMLGEGARKKKKGKPTSGDSL